MDEVEGLEPPTYALKTRRSTNWTIPQYLVEVVGFEPTILKRHGFTDRCDSPTSPHFHFGSGSRIWTYIVKRHWLTVSCITNLPYLNIWSSEKELNFHLSIIGRTFYHWTTRGFMVPTFRFELKVFRLQGECISQFCYVGKLKFKVIFDCFEESETTLSSFWFERSYLVKISWFRIGKFPSLESFEFFTINKAVLYAGLQYECCFSTIYDKRNMYFPYF